MELTFDTTAPDPFENPRYYSHAFDLFVRRLRRSFGNAKYFRVVEVAPGKRPHFHILIDRFIPHEWVTENFPAVGGGRVNWERWLGSDHVFAYITKYVTKSCTSDDSQNMFFYITGMRQVSASRGIYFIVPRNHTFYIICPRGDVDVEQVLRLSLRSGREVLRSLADFGSGPPDVFLVDRRRDIDLFSVDRSLCSETRESLRKKRFDQTSWQAHTSYPIYS